MWKCRVRDWWKWIQSDRRSVGRNCPSRWFCIHRSAVTHIQHRADPLVSTRSPLLPQMNLSMFSTAFQNSGYLPIIAWELAIPSQTGKICNFSGLASLYAYAITKGPGMTDKAQSNFQPRFTCQIIPSAGQGTEPRQRQQPQSFLLWKLYFFCAITTISITSRR